MLLSFFSNTPLITRNFSLLRFNFFKYKNGINRWHTFNWTVSSSLKPDGLYMRVRFYIHRYTYILYNILIWSCRWGNTPVTGGDDTIVTCIIDASASRRSFQKFKQTNKKIILWRKKNRNFRLKMLFLQGNPTIYPRGRRFARIEEQL